MSDFDTLIIGAGSAGLMCASRLCFFSKKYSKNMRIAIIDSNSRVGKKLAITGNGRCNVTNLDIDASSYNSDDSNVVNSVITDFDVESSMEFFSNELGLLLTCKGELVYPITNKSSSVIDCFRFYLVDNGVQFILDSKVSKISKCDSFYEVYTSNSKYSADNVVIATGGCTYKNTGSDGLGYKLLSAFESRESFIQVKPVLVQLTSNDKELKSLAGLRINADLSLYNGNELVKDESGELLFTQTGVSGICVMQLSRFLSNGRFHIVADLLPEYTFEFLKSYVDNCKKNFANRSVVDSLSGILLRPIIEVCLKRLSLPFNILINDLDERSIIKLVNTFKEFRIQISGTEGFDNAQVTSGGLKLSALTSDLELIKSSGLYACGEVLNVDGPCGGYNLQWAWSSADKVANGIMRRQYGI